jgi:peptide/nickel transport system ATP-binding protein/peptide/nickel transport system permease protein
MNPRFFRRLLRRPVAVACCAYLAALVVVAIVAPIAMPSVSTQNAGNLFAANQLPSWSHLLGTDTLGRDVLSRLLVGDRVTLIGVAEALIVVLVLAVPFGLAAGYLGGWTDRVVTWLADLAFSLPAVVIIIVVLSVFPASMLAGMVTFGVIAAPGLMRVVRSATLPVREELYIKAAEASGLSRAYILTRHILPRIAGVVIVQASLLAAVALGVQTGLAFLKLLVADPAPSWGGMVADGTSVLLLHPWLIVPPGAIIAVTMLALSLLGDSVRDATVESWSAPAVATRTRRKAARASAETTALAPPAGAPLLSVRDLSVSFPGQGQRVRVVEDVTFDIAAGEIVGIVGESGCGKSVTTAAIIGLLPGAGQVDGGSIWFGGRDLAQASETELRKIRGRKIGFVSQEPMVSLDPCYRVGFQIEEALRRHLGLSRQAAHARTLELLRDMHFADPAAVARRYPHELSGGMAQRVAIARALAGEPELLIADEPTTALDVTVQAEILELIRELQATRRMAVLIVTHDWGVVADLCDRVVVMYAGQIVERSAVQPIFDTPLHPYTEALLASNPHLAPEAGTLPTIPGTVPRPGSWPPGCRFSARCRYAVAACAELEVAMEVPYQAHETRCIRHDELSKA